MICMFLDLFAFRVKRKEDGKAALGEQNFGKEAKDMLEAIEVCLFV